MAPASQRTSRHSLKKVLDEQPVTAKSLARPYHINGDLFERAYKEHLIGFRSWKHENRK